MVPFFGPRSTSHYSNYRMSLMLTCRHSECCQLELEKIPVLIKMFQTVRNKRISKFISSNWQWFKCLSVAQTACH